MSYTQADQAWAVWIAWLLEQDGFRVLVQAWDMVAGSNWISRMDQGVVRTARTVAVLSPDYLSSVYGTAEWQAAWAEDPHGLRRKLIPVLVRGAWPPGLLNSVVGIDLVGLSEAEAQQRLRDEIAAAVRGRAKPGSIPPFPPTMRAVPAKPRFPGTLPEVSTVPGPDPHFTGRAAQLDAIRTGLVTAGNPDTPIRTSKPWIRSVERALAAVAALTTVILAVVGIDGWLRGPQRQCATVTAKPASPVYLEIGQPPLRQKRYGEQVELYPALEPVDTPQGTYRAVLVRQGMTTYGWMLDSHLTPTTCNPR